MASLVAAAYIEHKLAWMPFNVDTEWQTQHPFIIKSDPRVLLPYYYRPFPPPNGAAPCGAVELKHTSYMDSRA